MSCLLRATKESNEQCKISFIMMPRHVQKCNHARLIWPYELVENYRRSYPSALACRSRYTSMHLLRTIHQSLILLDVGTIVTRLHLNRKHASWRPRYVITWICPDIISSFSFTINWYMFESSLNSIQSFVDELKSYVYTGLFVSARTWWETINGLVYPGH